MAGFGKVDSTYISLLSNARSSQIFTLPGHIHKFSFDPAYEKVVGYWACTGCNKLFNAGGPPLHNPGCNLSLKTVVGVYVYKNSNFVYIFGPKESSGLGSPFKKEEILKVQEFVKKGISQIKSNRF